MKNNQSIWHCSFLGENDEGIQTYSAPKEYKLKYNYLSVNPTTGNFAVLQYGERVTKFWTMIAKRRIFEDVFKEGDLLYIEGCEPNTASENYVNGDGANARIQSVLPYHLSISINLEKIQP